MTATTRQNAVAADLAEKAKAAAAGDRTAAEEVLAATQDDVYALALRMLAHPADAEDAAQEILVITADEAEKLTVESLGAATASPSWLRKELEMEGTSFTSELERVHRSARWE